uniref:Uncharacterized protein n=1 Tax=Arundo donax TaxID=35708 RepID=A0A0A9CEX5_ARUDO
MIVIPFSASLGATLNKGNLKSKPLN